jgi:mercuric ion transport protein
LSARITSAHGFILRRHAMRLEPNKCLWIGGVGAVVTALCCFTPILVIALAAIGAASLVAYLDAVLFPLLAFFLFVAGYGWLCARKRPAEGNSAESAPGQTAGKGSLMP